jgi:ribonuclease P protein component
MMPSAINKFSKPERLSGVTAIANLFENGKGKLVYPIRVVYIRTGDSGSRMVRAGFSVSKKTFKKATDRNLLKRRMREAYRLNKSSFTKRGITNLDMMFIYTAKEILPYAAIEKSISTLVNKLG